MSAWNKKLLSTIIYFLSATLFLGYLLSVRQGFSLPLWAFWVSVGLLIFTVVFQSFRTQLSSKFEMLIIIEIAVAALLFHLVYQISIYGLYGSDAYIDLVSAEGILATGFIRGAPQYINPASYFPLIHVLGAQVALVTGWPMLEIAKWMPAFFSLAFIPIYYLFNKKIFKEIRITLFATLFLVCLQQYILFCSLYIRETLALFFAICCLYLYFTSKLSAYSSSRMVLAIFFFIVTVVSHHLTSFMLFVFILIQFIFSKLVNLRLVRKRVSLENVETRVGSVFLAFAFVGITFYWGYVITTPLNSLSKFARDLLSVSQWGMGTYASKAGVAVGAIQNIRGFILFYGFFAFLLVFGFILLFQLVNRGKKHLEIYSFTTYPFLCGIVGLMQMYVLKYGVGAFPDRFLMYGWLLGSGPLCVAILKAKTRILAILGFLSVILFMFYNIFGIDPLTWDSNAKGLSYSTSVSDYALAKALDFSEGKVISNSYSRYAIYELYQNLGDSEQENVDLSKFDWIIINKTDITFERLYYPTPRTSVIAQMETLGMPTSQGENKVYESNELSVFTHRG